MENTILVLKTYVDGGIGDTLFPNTESPIEIGAFRYDAKRMGGAPTITASVNYPSCLDDEWTDKVYAEFRGEKYYLKQTPTSSYNNESSLYKHDLELVSERIILDNVYFYDAVAQGETPSDDKPVSNSTKFVFWGDIHAFATRLAASLRYSKLDYTVVVDENISSEEKLVSFEDTFFSTAIQEAYNTYDVPYYFVGKTIHFGYTNNVISTPIEYGVDNAFLSIAKNNANYKTVNRVTGTGSTDNIPFYYPNNSPKGNINAEVQTSSDDFSVQIIDYEKFSNEVGIDDVITCVNKTYGSSSTGNKYLQNQNIDFTTHYFIGSHTSRYELLIDNPNEQEVKLNLLPSFDLKLYELVEVPTDESYSSTWVEKTEDYINGTFNIIINGELFRENISIDSTTIRTVNLGAFNGLAKIEIVFNPQAPSSSEYWYKGSISFRYSISKSSKKVKYWEYNGDKMQLDKIGLLEEGTPMNGDTITQKLVKYIKTSRNLMPSIYRETEAEERFYNAINDEYVDANGNDIEFPNPYVEGNPKEHIITVEDLKPTIKETTNDISWMDKDKDGNDVKVYQRIDMFSEFAYDIPDNDETYEEEDESGNVTFKHSYFFAKLRKLPFNLFEHAIENQPMTISFTSGSCSACNFKIGVSEGYPQYNPVQVNADGTLKRDAQGRVVCGVNEELTEDDMQESQQDTSKGEVWIALQKEEDTYGTLMPKAPTYDDNGNETFEGYRPKACTNAQSNDGDSFVILGINLPKEYILSAEKKLEDEIIKYMRENNEEKFKFSVSFSRIYFEENEEMLNLNENSRINILYNGNEYTLYVNSFSYQMSSGEILPQITVELDDALTISKNAILNAINSVKSEVGKALSNIDVIGLASPYFLRRDVDDEANGRINFKKGVKFGEGGKVEILDNNSARLSIDYLEVTKKATFTSLEIQEKTHVGGQMLITPAAINCGEVEEFSSYYRCYFQTKGTDGDEIFNQFAINDQAICQTFNAWGGKYYWRLVVGVGADYIDLSKTDCDTDSDIPSAGDKIIQLGNRTDKTRQAAQVLSSHGENAPSFIMYNGIDSFDLTGKEVTGIVWNPSKQEPQMFSYGDFFFGDRNLVNDFITFQKKEGDSRKKLHINADITLGPNSNGLSNLSEWASAETKINNAEKKAENASSEASQASATAQSATSTANSAHSLAETANTNATNASTAAGEAKTAAQTAKESAELASSTASEAERKATEAIGTANTASTNASEAIGTANTASTNATNALGKAQEAEEAASEATSLASEAKAAVEAIGDSVTDLDTKIGNIETGVEESIKEINARLDGVVENYFEEGVPTTTNKPVTEWKAASEDDDYELINHVGDTYTNIQEYINNDTTPDAGKSWRWCWCNDASITDKIAVTDKEGITRYLHWHPIADSDAVKALLEASKAKTAADGKSKTFVSQPVPPYKEGDLWVQGGNGDIMRCKDKVYRTSGSFVADDWEKASKYTDDTKANEAQETANAAKAALDELTADGMIQKSEVESLKSELSFVGTDRMEILANVSLYQLNKSQAFGDFNAFVFSYINSLNEIIGATNYPVAIPQDFHEKRDAYYGSRYILLQLIAESSRSAINNAQSTANAAETAANDAEQMVMDMNNDQYITHSEKRSLRAIVKKISSYEGDSLPSDGLYTGEIHDWLNIARQKADDEVTEKVEEAYDAACDVFALAYGPMELGSDEITDLGENNDARRLFQERLERYYTAINVLINFVPVSDYEYLKAALGNAASLDVEGVVLSQMMGVKDEYNKVRALLNGSNVGKETEHGKLMLAAGIPTDGTIRNKISEATTRIYEDGCMFSKNLHLEEGCTIGAFTLSEDAILVDGCGTIGGGQTVSMSRFGFIARGTKSTENACLIERDIFISAAGDSFGLIDAETHLDSDNAFFIRKGVFSGFRPKTRIISTSGTHNIDEFDHTIIVDFNTSNASVYLKLPKSPLDGQEYNIYTTDNEIKLYFNSAKPIHNLVNGTTYSNNDYSFTGANRRYIRLNYSSATSKWYSSYQYLS